jgi:hypothetical protein
MKMEHRNMLKLFYIWERGMGENDGRDEPNQGTL